MRTRILAVGVVVGTLTLLPAASEAAARPCARFIVGKANSSAYPDFRLPARGRATRASCLTLRRIARRLHSGRYELPVHAFAVAPSWGRRFRLRHAGRNWTCRFQHRGGSGPTYAVRCSRRGARLSWNTG